jgi:hypothetical protein
MPDIKFDISVNPGDFVAKTLACKGSVDGFRKSLTNVQTQFAGNVKGSAERKKGLALYCILALFHTGCGCLRCLQKRCWCSCRALPSRSTSAVLTSPVSNENRESKEKGSGTLLHFGTFSYWLRMLAVSAKAVLVLMPRFATALHKCCAYQPRVERKSGVKEKRVWHFIAFWHCA